MKTVVLPDGLEMVAFTEIESSVLYHEIFETQTYLKHGITVEEENIVFDVGANIGMFALYMATRFKGLTIHAFEPVPQVFRLLEHNDRHAIGSKANLVLHPYGLSDTAQWSEFQFSSLLSITAGMYASQLESNSKKSGNLFDWLKAIAHDLFLIRKISATVRNVIVSLLSLPLVNVIVSLLLLLPLLLLLVKIRLGLKRVKCRLRTLSSVLKETRVEVVHLTKIDVEGSEADVLKGIEEGDWKKLRQLVIEVHDLNDRVKNISALLVEKGYKIVVAQEDWHLHRLTGIYTIYAKRSTR